jgi:hypothetical protein
MPIAADMKVGDDGTYYADVGGCRWHEYGRFPDPQSGEEQIGMQTPCLPSEGLFYTRSTGDVTYFIQ